MRSGTKITVFIAGVLMCGVLSFLILPKETTKAESTLKAGAGDDFSGVIMKEALKELPENSNVEAVDTEDTAECYTFEDCCSNAAQWALYSNEIDMAFYCSSMASHLVSNDDRFEIYSPVIMNSEVLAYKDGTTSIDHVGMPKGRKYLQTLCSEKHPEISEFSEISIHGLNYSLEEDQVDAAILDITKAALLPRFNYQNITDSDYISYVLVIRSDIKDTEAFRDFVESYDRTVEKLNDPAVLSNTMRCDKKLIEDSRVTLLKIEE